MKKYFNIISKKLCSYTSSLPVTLPASLAAFSAVAMFFLVISQFRTFLVWPIGLVVAYLTFRYTHKLSLKTHKSSNESKWCDIIVVSGFFLWVIVNAILSSQHVVVDRDPGTYAVTAAWLVNHISLHIPLPDLFHGIPGVVYNSHGFGLSTISPNQLFAQGSHLLPALMGSVGKLGNYNLMLHVNALLGGIALLAVYGFARLIVKPRWAVIAVGTLAVSLPFIYFSRDSYTEPLAAALTFSALAMILIAQRTGKNLAWLLAGVITAAGALTRIDAYLVIAAIETFIIIKLIITEKADRIAELKHALFWAIGAAPIAILAWLDLHNLSSGYYQSQIGQIKPELILVVALLLVGILAVVISWKTSIISHLNSLTIRWRSAAAAVAVLLFFAVLASRPFWLTSYQSLPTIINGVHQLVPVRTYAEQTIQWIVWYLGPVLMILGILGLAISSAKSMKDKKLELLPVSIVVLVVSIVYLINPNVAGDQIWASRRLVPVIMPGLAVLGALALQEIYSSKQILSKRFKKLPDFKVIVTCIATLAIVGPLFVSYPFLKSRTYVPELAQVKQLCKSIPSNSVLIWLGDAQSDFMQATTNICGNKSVGIIGDLATTSTALQEMAKPTNNHGQEIVVGLYSSELNILPLQDQQYMKLITAANYKIITPKDGTFPRSFTTNSISIMLGRLNPEGTISPLN